MRGFLIPSILLMIFGGLFGVTKATDAQDLDLTEVMVSLELEQVPLKEVLDEIEQQTDFSFAVSYNAINMKRTISVTASRLSVEEVLKYMFRARWVSWAVSGKTILLKKWPKSDQKSLNSPLQDPIGGQVTDEETGETLPGVNIMIKGTNTGTSTDQNGDYKLTVPSLQDTIVVSFIGYETQEIPINGRTEVDIQLVSETVEGEELVVTAFGETMEAQDVIGAVTSVSTEELEQLKTAPSSNLTTSLVGRIPGLIGYQRSGEPGANNTDFFIRGVTSFGYSRNPLILIDNIESSTTDLARLNPSDIANFSVLKDATATSLYGSRAANGVLLIKTKEGYQGSLEVDVRIENSITEPTDVPEFADPVTYMEKANEATLSRDPLAPLPYSRRKIDKTEAGANPYLYPAVDWREELFKDYTANRRLNLNVNGGGSVAQYYVSGSIDQSNGLLKVPELSKFNNNIDLKSYSMRSNINVNLTQSTTLKMKLGGNFDDYGGPLNSGEEVYEQVVSANPVRFPARFPVDSAHAYTEHPLFGSYEGPGGREFNPFAEMVKGYKNYSRSKINAQFSIDQDFSSVVQGLQVGALINVERYAYSSNSRAYQPYYYEASPVAIGSDDYTLRLLNPDGGTNYLDYTPLSKTVTSSLFLQAQANYNRTFQDRHGVSGLFVFNARNETYDNVDDLQASLPHRNVNLAARMTYNYDRIYYAEFNFGLNASERFAKNHRWGFFPSVGVAWQISNENFWEPISSVITRFKLRATYGLSGNDAIGAHDNRFKYLSTVNLDDPAYGYATGSDASYHRNGISISRYSNPSITWERAQKLNLGVEFMLFDQLDAEANFYRESRSNILQNRSSIPASMGLSDTPRANTGEVESEGFSTNLTYTANMSNWLLQVRGNFTYARNEYIKLDEPRFPNSPNRSQVGQPIGRQYGLYAERLFVDQAEVENSPEQNFGSYGPGDIKYRDVNGDGQITDLDRVPMGFPVNPEITYGFGFTLGYRNIDFSAFFQGLARTSFWIDPSETAPFVGGHQLLKAFADDHWTRNNRNLTAMYPHFSTESRPEGEGNNEQLSTWWMRDGSFLRIKDVQIGYRLPKSIVSRLSMKSLRIYVNSRNLARFSKFDLWDPEMAGNGLGYPLQRTFNIGLNVKF